MEIDIDNASHKLDLRELTTEHLSMPNTWDCQIKEDARSGRLDAFYQRLQRENEGQPDTPLDEVLNKEELP